MPVLHDMNLRLESMTTDPMIHCHCKCNYEKWIYRGSNVNEAIDAFRKHCLEIGVLSEAPPTNAQITEEILNRETDAKMNNVVADARPTEELYRTLGLEPKATGKTLPPVPKLSDEQAAAVRKAHEILTSFRGSKQYIAWMNDGTGGPCNGGMYTGPEFHNLLEQLESLVTTKYRVCAEYDVYAPTLEDAVSIVHHGDAMPINYGVGWSPKLESPFSSRIGLDNTHAITINIDPKAVK